MTTNQIFIGYNKNNKRCLLYLKNGKYYDLETEEIYSSNDIYINSLVNYNTIITTKSYFKNDIIKNYQKEESEELNLKQIYIGNLYQITKILKQNWYGSTLINMGCNTTFEVKPITKKTLLQELCYNNYKCILNNTTYQNKAIIKPGDVYVDSKELVPFKKEFDIQETSLPKRKVLEIYNSRYGFGGKI